MAAGLLASGCTLGAPCLLRSGLSWPACHCSVGLPPPDLKNRAAGSSLENGNLQQGGIGALRHFLLGHALNHPPTSRRTAWGLFGVLIRLCYCCWSPTQRLQSRAWCMRGKPMKGWKDLPVGSVDFPESAGLTFFTWYCSWISSSRKEVYLRSTL